MQELLKVQKRLVPDIFIVMQKRYRILRSIYFAQPIGRRALAEMLGMSERVLRTEVAFLKDRQLITMTSAGMSITEIGKTVYHELITVIDETSEIRQLEDALAQKLSIAHVVIVQGDSDVAAWVKQDLCRAMITALDKVLIDGDVIAVNGGTTMAEIAGIAPANFANGRDLLFVPARGGLGEELSNQANTICSRLAEKTGTRHRALYVPEQVTESTYRSLLAEPTVRDTLNLLQSANAVLHGIGDAVTMTQRRHTDTNTLEIIKEKQAVGEAFGYYFDENGNVVYQVPTIGLQLGELANIPHVFIGAGGKSKAKAIASFVKHAPHHAILFTDEGAAHKLLEG
ncbi:sugar-binding transcriptional regulator [Brochothrix campestris]|uniref:Putative transcriptional regulator CggR n=1 Tax=Brochothrix campestris FSL F6-1037 TaxID=1265861 RepID=W7D3Z0_9LIST|nr:sugar-binding domain-containing protein [Brochothrix campestris]EUJ39988.1 putative transcriptional regulator CggR [Brochothrix campestris FSL F6-1037]